jgi:hypothetical protein
VVLLIEFTTFMIEMVILFNVGLDKNKTQCTYVLSYFCQINVN